jgi:hypothetical protein
MRKCKRMAGLGAAAMAALALGACQTPAVPGESGVPAQLTCLYLPNQLSTTEEIGPSKILRTTRLERGPYLSERESPEGTYYRAPQGGIYISTPNTNDKTAAPVNSYTFEGGIYVPRDAAAPVRLYHYRQHKSGPVTVPPAGAGCSSAAVVRDPASGRVSVASYAAAGGAIVAAKMEMEAEKSQPLPVVFEPQVASELNKLTRSTVPITEKK